MVGFDGSPNSVLAVNWALTEARLRDGVVMLCHVSPGWRASGDARDDERKARAHRVLARGARHASRQTMTVQVIRELLLGGPAQQLLFAASGATLLVVGTRGEDGFPGLRLGSVSAQVARHAPCTVIVVPDPAGRGDNRRDRQIVVGVDGSTGSKAALAFAFDEATDRQAELRAVYVFDVATVQSMSSLPQADLRRLHVNAADTAWAGHRARGEPPRCGGLLRGVARGTRINVDLDR
ncbi:universal stress protein [Actinophytocola sp.]|uniref:universal stress protein n=1 Tax=Actinophytocola sp. TaxID=1872138 RepID=UPI003D6B10B9